MVNEMHRIRSSFIDISWDSIECTDADATKVINPSSFLHNYCCRRMEGYFCSRIRIQ